MLHTLRDWAAALRRDGLALFLAARDPRVPWYAKALAAATAAYALSPIDLIPDFIPVIGYLDDLIILPLAIAVTIRLIPAEVMADLRRQAENRLARRPPRSRAGAVFVVGIWLVFAGLAGWVVLF